MLAKIASCAMPGFGLMATPELLPQTKAEFKQATEGQPYVPPLTPDMMMSALWAGPSCGVRRIVSSLLC